MNALTPVRSPVLALVSDRELDEGLHRTPLNEHVVWAGAERCGRPNSILTLTMDFVEEGWTPVSLRLLVQKAARLSGSYGLRPDAVRKAIWAHQSAALTSFLLVRSTALGEFVTVTDVARPCFSTEPLQAGDVVIRRPALRNFGGTSTCVTRTAPSFPTRA